MESHFASVFPVAVAVSMVSLFGLAAYFSGDFSTSSPQSSQKKRLRSSSLNGASSNNAHMGESQNYLPSATRNGLATLQLGSDLSEVGLVLTNSSNRRRQSYSNINSRYPLTARLGHVVEALDDLRQLQKDTETALEEQCKQTEHERQLRSRMERSLQAESQLREDAEASIQLYKDVIEKLRTEQQNQSSSLNTRNTRIKHLVSTLNTMIADKSITSDHIDIVLQLLASLESEARL